MALVFVACCVVLFYVSRISPSQWRVAPFLSHSIQEIALDAKRSPQSYLRVFVHYVDFFDVGAGAHVLLVRFTSRLGAFEQRLFRLGVRDGDIIFYADGDGAIHVLNEASGGGSACSARRPLSQSERALEALNLETNNNAGYAAFASPNGVGVGQLRARLNLMVLKNDMTLGNCIWFIVSSFVHQNTPYSPRFASIMRADVLLYA